MKFLQLLLVALPAVLAAPALDEQTPFGQALGFSNLAGNVFGEIAKGVQHIIHGVEDKVEQEVKQWFSEGREFVKENGLVCKLRLASCDDRCSQPLQLHSHPQSGQSRPPCRPQA